MSKQISPVPMRGMRDLLPEEVARRQAVLQKIRKIYASYGFMEIETPVVERIELLNTGEGGDNEKQAFGVLKRGLSTEDLKAATSPRDLLDGGLRFDLTVPLTRYYANNQAKLPNPFKTMQIGNVFRAERPQKGRYRQFTQCDIDIIGDGGYLAECELVSATCEALQEIGFADFTVRINDRRILSGIVESCGFSANDTDQVLITVDKLDKINLEGVQAELKEKGYSLEAVSRLSSFLREVSNKDNPDEIFSLLPEQIDQTAVTELKEIIATVSERTNTNYSVQFDPTLVRGMGYYTGPIFEIEDKDFSSSIAGGGRYDKMIGKYLSQDVPACGFSIGFERIISLLEERKLINPTTQDKKVIIFDEDKVSTGFAMNLASIIRQEKTIVTVEKKKKNTKKHLDDLKNLGYSSFCVLESESDSPQFKQLS